MKYETVLAIGLAAFVFSFAYFSGGSGYSGCGFGPVSMMGFGAGSAMFGVIVLLLALAVWLAVMNERRREKPA